MKMLSPISILPLIVLLQFTFTQVFLFINVYKMSAFAFPVNTTSLFFLYQVSIALVETKMSSVVYPTQPCVTQVKK